MSGLIRIRIVGCGRILPAHLRGFHLLHECGVDGIVKIPGPRRAGRAILNGVPSDSGRVRVVERKRTPLTTVRDSIGLATNTSSERREFI